MDLKQTLGNIPAIRDRQQIPVKKRIRQWVDTALGLAIVAGTLWVKAKLLPEMPWLGVAIGCFTGGWVASKQLMVAISKAVPQAIAAVVGALSGKKPDAEPPPDA